MRAIILNDLFHEWTDLVPDLGEKALERAVRKLMNRRVLMPRGYISLREREARPIACFSGNPGEMKVTLL